MQQPQNPPGFSNQYPDTGESGETYEAEMGACERCRGAPAIINLLCKNCDFVLKGLVRHAELLQQLVVVKE